MPTMHRYMSKMALLLVQQSALQLMPFEVARGTGSGMPPGTPWLRLVLLLILLGKNKMR